MNLYYLFGGCIFLVVICWLLFQDIFSPVSILCEMFAISSYFAIISAGIHNVDISIKTVIYILTQLLVSVIIGSIMHILTYRKQISYIENKIEINHHRYKLLLGVMVIASAIYVVFFGRAILSSRGTSISEQIFSFRQSSVTTGVGIPSYIQYLSKGIYAFAYFSIYIYMHNRTALKRYSSREKANSIYLVSVLLLFLVAILSGARAEIVYFLCAVAIYYSIFSNKIKHSSFSVKRVVRILLYGGVILLAFYYLSILLGRNTSNFMSYISAYFGSPIIAFNNFYLNPIRSSEVWGKEFLYSIIHFLQKLGIVGGEISSTHKEYLYLNGRIYTNVYTCFRSYIIDVGIGASFIVQIVLVWFYENLYIRIYDKKDIFGYANTSIIIYGLISYGVVLLFYGNYFFGLILSSHTLIQIVFICFFSWFVSRNNYIITVKRR